MILERLNCKRCRNELDLSDFGGEVKCNICSQVYKIQNYSSHAQAESGHSIWYKWEGDTIARVYFNNPPLEILEEAWQETLKLDTEEIRPWKLTPVVKSYYDSLKQRLQEFLALPQTPNLNKVEKQKIQNDPLDVRLNLEKLLFKYLIKAFNFKVTEINLFLNSHKSMIKKLIWIRNKKEHIAPSLWPVPSKVYEDLGRNPEKYEPGIEGVSVDVLNFDFLIRVNHAVIDICKFLLTLDPIKREQWHFAKLEAFRINKNS